MTAASVALSSQPLADDVEAEPDARENTTSMSQPDDLKCGQCLGRPNSLDWCVTQENPGNPGASWWLRRASIP